MEILKNPKLIITFIGIFLFFWTCSFMLFTIKKWVGKLIVTVLLLAGVYFVYHYFKLSFTTVILPYTMVPAILIGSLVGLYSLPPKLTPIFDMEFRTLGGKKYIRNVFAGNGIFGASRSGKTASVIYSYLLHFAKWDFVGLIYDYKNGELTEICIPLFEREIKIFAVHLPELSVRINPINPKYVGDEKEINSVVKVLLDNLADVPDKGQNNFFYDTAESLFSAVVLKFALEHPHFCTLPHVIAFILTVDFALKEEEKKGLKEDSYNTFGGLKEFLIKNKRVKLQASSFILGLASEKQTAGVISTLANSLRKISFPESFWVLSGSDIDLGLNKKENPTILSILNEPKNEPVLTPVLATITHVITREMMVRGRHHSFICLDEAVTMKLKNMARIVATMASFKISTLFCAQDISQGIVQYGRDGFKAILANLSTLFFGRANDPDTGKFYEQYFEPKKIKTRSRTRGRSNSTTIGEKEVPKVRAHEFTNFTPGKFAFLSGGKAEVIRFPKFKIEERKLENKELNKEKMISKYNEIIEEMNLFAKQIGLTSH